MSWMTSVFLVVNLPFPLYITLCTAAVDPALYGLWSRVLATGQAVIIIKIEHLLNKKANA